MEIRNCPEGSRIYIWGDGDTLASVARLNGASEQLIQGANPGTDFASISPGDSICLPISGSEGILLQPGYDEEFGLDPEFNAPRPICPIGAQTHIWARGDTLLGIALRYGTTQQQIRAANPFVNLDNPADGTPICIPQRTPQCSDGLLVTVSQGDTISSIARTHGVTAGALMERNPYIDPSQLAAGMVLCIPPRTVIPPPAPTPTPPPAPCPPGYTAGTVRYGETIGDILIRHNVSYQAFRLSNPLLTLSRLLPGQRYCVPPMGSRGLCAPGSNSHVLAIGESLASVAAQYRTTPGALLQLNANLAPGDFIPGRIICV